MTVTGQGFYGFSSYYCKRSRDKNLEEEKETIKDIEKE